MALTLYQQILEQFRKSNEVIICLRKDYTLDGLTSAMALASILKKLEKSVDIVCDGFTLKKNHFWLKNDITIQPEIIDLQKFIIALDIAPTGIEKLSYNTENHKLKIYITPKRGSVDPRGLKTETSPYRFDLIIALDAPDLESLGDIYFKNIKFFQNTPVINIDHTGENENYGQINMVELSSTAIGELIFDFIWQVDKTLLDSRIATQLLAGMMSKTKSFKTPNVASKTLRTASQLIANGANKDLVVNNLYRNRNVQTLNLWGKVLHRLKSSQDGRLVWSLIPEEDFISTSSSADDLHGIIDELIAALPGVEVIVLLYRYGSAVEGQIHSLGQYDVTLLAKNYKPDGSRWFATLTVPKITLVDAETEVIKTLAENMSKR